MYFHSCQQVLFRYFWLNRKRINTTYLLMRGIQDSYYLFLSYPCLFYSIRIQFRFKFKLVTFKRVLFFICMYKFLPIYEMCLAIYGTNNHERTMEILYKLENKLHNRNCCKFARTGMQQVGQAELVYFEMKNPPCPTKESYYGFIFIYFTCSGT